MRRSGFTMVELIFVIIIIGILSAAAIPKFGDIKDRSKINSEYAALSSLDGAIVGAIEFQQEDYGDMGVLWHDEESNATSSIKTYKAINDSKSVLSKIIKKGDSIKIVAFASVNEVGSRSTTSTQYDVLFLEGTASNGTNGVKKEKDVFGKPDKNDFWIFNTSSVDMNITVTGNTFAPTLVESGELALIDSNSTIDYSAITLTVSTNTTSITIVDYGL